jgi:CRP/FNR family transcriptional regulator, cyclic AMP receptor protein
MGNRMKRRKAREELRLGDRGSLRSQELFGEVPESRVAKLEKNSMVREFAAGHIFFQPGGTGDALYFLERGRVETFRTSGRKKLIIAELGPPAVFGEMACVGASMYHCAARAVEDCRVRMVARKELELLMREHPSVTRRLLDLVSRRFVGVLMELDATSFRQLIPRLARLLLKRAEGDFVRGMTHKEIAEHLRVYRESATAALGELRKAGILAIERKRIRILDRRRLERAGNE